MLRIWIPVGLILGLIISALIFMNKIYNKGLIAGENNVKVEILQKENAELAESLKSTQENQQAATKDDLQDRARRINNEQFAVPRSIIPDANGTDELFVDEQFLKELDKLQ